MHQSLALPGQSLGPTSEYQSGTGTHIHRGQVCASIAGSVMTLPNTNKSPPASRTTHAARAKQTLTVQLPPRDTQPTSAPPPVAPRVHDRVLARVLRLAQRQATLAILAISPHGMKTTTSREMSVADDASENPLSTYAPLPAPLLAVLRAQDVRLTEKDSVSIPTAVRVGDIVHGVVLSLGDQSNGYYIGTGGNAFGVVIAESERGVRMVPVSWEMMAEASVVETEADGTRNQTKSLGVGNITETRKVARPLGMAFDH